MSETKIRNKAVPSDLIIRENQRIAKEGGNIDDLAAAVGMTVGALRPRLAALVKNGVPLSKLTSKQQGKAKVDYSALREVLAEVNAELSDEVDA